MKDVVVVGAGKIGVTIAQLLGNTGDYNVTVTDRAEDQLKSLAGKKNITTKVVDIADASALEAVLSGKFAVLSAAPYQLTMLIANAAAKTGVHYLDLTEDVASTRHVKELAKTAKSAFIPQCGLAPGFISIVAYDLAKKFDKLESIGLRVGALPQFPTNSITYNLTWSTDGVINEYIEPCEAIVNGKLTMVPAMEEREEFSLEGVEYEAFNTSGGLGTLAETLEGKVRTLNYRTIRYPGHCAIFKTLLNDLGLRHRRELFKEILETAVPGTQQDVIVIFVTVTGYKGGRLTQETYANKVYNQTQGELEMTGIQVTTASAICAVVDMLADGSIPAQGFMKQEDIALDAFLANRFGKVYA